jgi:hypothetical protein
MAVSGSTTINITGKQTGTTSLGSTPVSNRTLPHAVSYTDGTVANQFDQLYMAERTVADGANDDIDLAGVLTDAFGNTLTGAELVEITIINKQFDGTVNTTDLTIDGTVTNGFKGFLNAAGIVGPIGPGGHFSIGCPDAGGLGTITASTEDIIRVTNSAGAANTYQIAIRMRSSA